MLVLLLSIGLTELPPSEMRSFARVTSTARARNLSSGIKILMESFVPWAEPIAHVGSVDEHAATRKLVVPGGMQTAVFGINDSGDVVGSYEPETSFAETWAGSAFDCTALPRSRHLGTHLVLSLERGSM